MIGFEQVAGDAFHFDPANARQSATSSSEGAGPDEAAVVDAFLQAILERRAAVLDYRPPYGAGPNHVTLTPGGLLWDRDLRTSIP